VRKADIVSSMSSRYGLVQGCFQALDA
jgi:hypothetical protein